MFNRKKLLIPVLILILCLAFLSSCGSTNKPPEEEKKPETAEEIEERNKSERYAALKTAFDAAAQKDSFVLFSDRVSEISAEYPDESQNFTEKKVEYSENNIHRNENNYDYVRLEVYEGDAFDPEICTSGYLQKDGVLYTYSEDYYGEDQVLWSQSVAYADRNQLPAEEIFLQLPSYSYIKDIKFTDSVLEPADIRHNELNGLYKKYEISVKDNCGVTLTRLLAGQRYAITDITITVYTDSEGCLVRSAWDYTESVVADAVKLTSRVSAASELAKSAQVKPLTWFEDASTYVRPEYNDVTENARVFFCNIPSKILMDVRIPQIIENYPGAGMINNDIRTRYEAELTETPESLTSKTYDDYVWCQRDYVVYRFGSIYEICINLTDGSVLTGASSSRVDVYAYDALAGKTLEAAEFLEAMGYTEESFLEKAAAISWGDEEGQTLATAFSFEELLSMFYFDEDSDPIFVINETYTGESD